MTKIPGFLSEEEYERGYTTLYHGTDARMVAMSVDERKKYFLNCRNAIDDLWELFKPLLQELDSVDTAVDHYPWRLPKREIDKYKELLESKDRFLYYNLVEKLNMIDYWKQGIQQYQYGDLYLTALEMKAERYAMRSFAGGELGLMVCRLVESADIIGIDYSKSKEINAIERVMQFALDEVNYDPVVFKLSNVPIRNLLTDEGKPLNEEISTLCQDFRYVGDYNLAIEDARHLKG